MQVLLWEKLASLSSRESLCHSSPLGFMMQCAVIGISVGKQLLYPEAEPHAVLETV